VGGGRPVLITDFRYEVQSRRETAGVTISIQKKDHLSAVHDAARRLRTDRLWFDESSLTLDRVRALRKKGLRLKGIKDPVAELRQRKDPAEIRALARAVSRAEEAFRELRRHIRPGATERELGLRLEWSMREKGARRTAFETIVASGVNGAMPHAGITDRRLRSGDLVTIDFGAEADGYYCDLTRTVSVGPATVRQREIHALVLSAQQAAIAAIAPGAACRDIDRAAREIIGSAGHAKHFGHATGHGIGLLVHEGPSLSSLAKERLAAGMVVTVEPGVYIPRWGGVRIEDMVLVTEQGARVLSSLPRDL
jgi:Xaa-Pro aminopeptidase